MGSYFRQQLESWLKSLDIKADRVLDVGGGSNPVNKRVKRWDVSEYEIMDYEVEEMKVPIQYKYDLNKRLDYAEYKYTDKYDVIFCLEVFEYIWNPMQALINLNFLLKENGVLYISFPFMYPHHDPYGIDYMRYTKWGVQKLLKETGLQNFEIIERYQRGGLKIQEWFVSEKMHPSKTYDGHDEIGYLVIAKKNGGD